MVISVYLPTACIFFVFTKAAKMVKMYISCCIVHKYQFYFWLRTSNLSWHQNILAADLPLCCCSSPCLTHPDPHLHFLLWCAMVCHQPLCFSFPFIQGWNWLSHSAWLMPGFLMNISFVWAVCWVTDVKLWTRDWIVCQETSLSTSFKSRCYVVRASLLF